MKKILTVVLSAMATCVMAFDAPTLGWSSWNTFALNISDSVIRSQADAMISTGLAKAGYRNVNIDDGYWDGRDDNGRVRLNDRLFPNGMRSLTDYIHGLGLIPGIYSDGGENSCSSIYSKVKEGIGVGFYGHEAEDCRQFFIDWNFDFIKIDYCSGVRMGLKEQEQYGKIRREMDRCAKERGKDIKFNMCRWAYPGTWVSEIADSWRTTGDIYCEWKSVKEIIRRNLYLQAFTGGGHYNDMDMLEIGRTLTHAEETTHMIYWSICSSPLLIGCDLTKIPESSLSLLKNKYLLAMNQDKLGIGAPVVQREGDVYVVAKDMEKIGGNKRAMAVVNLSDEVQQIDIDIRLLGMQGPVSLFDCLEEKKLPKASGNLHVTLQPHASAAFIVKGKRLERTVYQAEEAWLKMFHEMWKNEYAQFAVADMASLGAYVGHLGNGADNYMELRNVYSQRGGDYTLTIRYASEDERDLSMMVNGSQPLTLYGLYSGSSTDNWKTTTVRVKLRKGQNTVRLYNNDGWAPNIDYIELKPIANRKQ